MERPTDDERLISRPEVSERFGVSQRFLELAAVRGDGPPLIKIGRSARYRVGEVRAWIDGLRVRGSAE